MNLTLRSGDLDVYQGFLDESRDHLGNMEEKILALAENFDPAPVHGLFRALHSIKGVASYLELKDIQRLSHQLESVFDLLREGKLALDSGLVQDTLAALDLLNAMLAHLEAGISVRTQNADGSFSVEFESVGYEAEYEKLGIHLAAKKPPSPAPVETEDELITPEMRATFAKESGELVDATEQILLALAEKPEEDALFHDAFRNVHSFKGNCGFFGYAQLEKLCHRFETVLDEAKGSDRAARSKVVDVGLKVVDALKSALRLLSLGQAPEISGFEAHLAALEKAISKGGAPAAAPQAPLPIGELLVQSNVITPDQLEKALETQSRKLGEILIEQGAVTPEVLNQNLQKQAVKAPAGEPTRRDLRVDLQKLDHMLDLVGELVISSGMVVNHPRFKDGQAPELDRIFHQLQFVVGELQNIALGVRMIPIEGVFKKMSRLVHDLTGKCGKKARLILEGEKTEVDKNVADLIADPLVHMIRNSVDHGMETPEERQAAGKNPMGSITLGAGQEGSDICLTIQDDGRGLHRDKILNKAMEKGLCGEEARAFKDEDIFQFIFLPGFSTAAAVTSTSGRGVGMDVVKSNVEKLNGKISIRSKAGQGTEITLRIPLTLSIIEGMQVRVGSALFILPLLSVAESFSPKREQLNKLADGRELAMVRGKAFPILRLHAIHGIEADSEDITRGILLRLESHGHCYCLLVDELLGKRQTVVKSLPHFLGKVPGVSSCSILDNGEISLILDVAGLWQVHDEMPLSSLPGHTEPAHA